MEQIILAATICMALFGIIGIIDGFYFHLWKFELHRHAETRHEHLLHSWRLVLFLGILYFLFANDYAGKLWYVGIAFALIDLAILSFDVFEEGDSRANLGGLPPLEYYIHIVANGLHFASLALIIAAKPLSAWYFDSPILDRNYPEITTFLAMQLIPGTVLLTIAHFLLLNSTIAGYFSGFKNRFLKIQH
jgi:hypothetical protein